MAPVELSRAPKYLPYNYGSHFISVPELRRAIRQWKRDLDLKHLNGKSKEFLLDFALEHDILKKHFTEKNMAFPPPADSHMKKKPREAKREEERAAKAAARVAAKEAKKAEGPKKRGRKPKAKAEEPEKKEEPVPVATPAAAPGPKKVGRKLKAVVAAPAAAPEKKKRGPNAFAIFVKANKKPGMSMKDVAELYKKNKAAPKEEPKKEEPKKEEPKQEEPKPRRRMVLAPPEDTSVEERKMLPEALNLPEKEKDPLGASVVNLTPVLNAMLAKPSAREKAARGQSKTRPAVPSVVKSVRQLKKVQEASSSDDESGDSGSDKEILDMINLGSVRESFSSLADYAKAKGKSIKEVRKDKLKNLAAYNRARKEEEERQRIARENESPAEKEYKNKQKVLSELREKLTFNQAIKLNKLFEDMILNSKSIDKFIARAKELSAA